MSMDLSQKFSYKSGHIFILFIHLNFNIMFSVILLKIKKKEEKDKKKEKGCNLIYRT